MKTWIIGLALILTGLSVQAQSAAEWAVFDGIVKCTEIEFDGGRDGKTPAIGKGVDKVLFVVNVSEERSFDDCAVIIVLEPREHEVILADAEMDTYPVKRNKAENPTAIKGLIGLKLESIDYGKISMIGNYSWSGKYQNGHVVSPKTSASLNGVGVDDPIENDDDPDDDNEYYSITARYNQALSTAMNQATDDADKAAEILASEVAKRTKQSLTEVQKELTYYVKIAADRESAETVFWSGTGQDKIGSSTYVYALTGKTVGNTIRGSLSLTENGDDDLGTFPLEQGRIAGDRVSFNVTDADGYTYCFTLCQTSPSSMEGGVVEIRDNHEGMSGLTEVTFTKNP